MKTLFDAAVVGTVKERVMRLQPESAREWGTVNVVQMLAHCEAGLKMAMGEIQPKRAPFPFRVIGKLIKPMVFHGDKPMRKNSPTAKELWTADATADFATERDRLVATIDQFASERRGTDYPHPFFGTLTAEEWAALQYQHLDHHLRQFRV